MVSQIAKIKKPMLSAQFTAVNRVLSRSRDSFDSPTSLSTRSTERRDTPEACSDAGRCRKLSEIESDTSTVASMSELPSRRFTKFTISHLKNRQEPIESMLTLTVIIYRKGAQVAACRSARFRSIHAYSRVKAPVHRVALPEPNRTDAFSADSSNLRASRR